MITHKTLQATTNGREDSGMSCRRAWRLQRSPSCVITSTCEALLFKCQHWACHLRGELFSASLVLGSSCDRTTTYQSCRPRRPWNAVFIHELRKTGASVVVEVFVFEIVPSLRRVRWQLRLEWIDGCKVCIALVCWVVQPRVCCGNLREDKVS